MRFDKYFEVKIESSDSAFGARKMYPDGKVRVRYWEMQHVIARPIFRHSVNRYLRSAPPSRLFRLPHLRKHTKVNMQFDTDQ